MNFPAELKYSKSHEWVKMEDGVAVVGITDFAQDALGDVESVKAVSDILCPVSGTVAAVNEDLADAPEALNSDPYGSWIIKVDNITDEEDLMDAAAYEAFCAQEG